MRIWTLIMLGFVAGGCVAPRPLAQRGPMPSLPPPPPAFEPEMSADDHYLRGSRRRREPVFGEEKAHERGLSPKTQIALGAAGVAALEAIIWEATLRRECQDCEEHHLFPRQEGLRQRFEVRSINVDDWTLLVSKTQHREAHRQDGGYGPGGRWNWDWDRWWINRERSRLPTTADDVFIRALEMIREYGLHPYGLPIQYGYGRSISRDLYDVVLPPRSVK